MLKGLSALQWPVYMSANSDGSLVLVCDDCQKSIVELGHPGPRSHCTVEGMLGAVERHKSEHES
jgi:hypothetical protein